MRQHPGPWEGGGPRSLPERPGVGVVMTLKPGPNCAPPPFMACKNLLCQGSQGGRELSRMPVSQRVQVNPDTHMHVPSPNLAGRRPQARATQGGLTRGPSRCFEHSVAVFF